MYSNYQGPLISSCCSNPSISNAFYHSYLGFHFLFLLSHVLLFLGLSSFRWYVFSITFFRKGAWNVYFLTFENNFILASELIARLVYAKLEFSFRILKHLKPVFFLSINLYNLFCLSSCYFCKVRGDRRYIKSSRNFSGVPLSILYFQKS